MAHPTANIAKGNGHATDAEDVFLTHAPPREREHNRGVPELTTVDTAENGASPRPSREAQPKQTAVRLFSLFHTSLKSVLLLLALSVAAVGIEVAPPLLQGMLVDHVLTVNAAEHPSDTLLLLLLAIVTGLLLVRVAGAVVGVWKGYVSSRIGTAMTAELRDTLVEKLNVLPLAFHDRNQVGVLMSQVAYDTETLHTLIYHVTSGLFLQVLQLLGISIALFYLNPKLAAITLVPVPWIVAGSWYFTRYLQPRQHHYWEAVGKQATALMGMLSGIRVVKAFVQEGREIRRFRQASRRLRDSRLTVDVSTSTFTAAMGMLFATGGLAVWYMGGRDVLFGHMTLGSLVAFLAYLAMFYAPLTSLAESTSWFANFLGTSRRLCDVLDVPGEMDAHGATVPLGPVQGHIELEGVSFGYVKSRPVLKDVSFSIRPGQMVGVVGRSGSGKSTLVSLIARLYEADAGRIRIDGIDIRKIHRQDLRRQIGMVPQDPFLFRGTIAENIAYGNADATPEQIMLAAKQADAHDFIMELPLAYSTQLREGGAGLSGGERQRLSIARALLFDPAILILDEATSNVDAESERAICNTLDRWTQQRAAIVISHRLSTLRNADWLLVFDEGRLVEQGTQEQLMAQEGVYRRLANIQGDGTDNHRFLFPAIPQAAIAGKRAGQGGRAHDAAVSPQTLSWLDPHLSMIDGNRHGVLHLKHCKKTVKNVYAVRAFPTLFEHQYISLRRRDEISQRPCELGIIASLDPWPAETQQSVVHSLRNRYCIRRIREITQIRTSENVLALSVTTDGGPASIRLEKPGEGSQPYGRGGLLLADAAGNYFVIADRSSIPRRQQRLLTLYFGD